MESTIRLYNPLPRFVFGLKGGMGEYTRGCSDLLIETKDIRISGEDNGGKTTL